MRKWKDKMIDYKTLLRFFKKVEIVNNCWIWQNSLTNGGYGVFRYNGKLIRSHRFCYEIFKQEIPDKLDLDHLCRNRKCVNPDHLEPVTKMENQRRSPISKMNKTHCPKGHEYFGNNLYINPKGDRFCRICKNEHERLRRKKPEVKLYNREYLKNWRKNNA